MNIGYDLLTWEGDILRLQFWAHAFEILKKTGAVFLQTEGRLTGCWVMRIDDEPGAAATSRRRRGRRAGDAGRRRSASREDEPREKVIVRSNGTVTYVGKDMAYQFWKFGLLGKDFHYRVVRRPRATAAAVVDHVRRGERATDHPAFGGASWVYNVIDTRQSYLQKLLKQALAALGHERAGRALDPLLVRDGRAVARHRARARLRPERRRRPAVRRGVRPQGSRRQGRRPARPADREGGRRGREAQSGSARRAIAAASRKRSRSPRCATSW